MTTITYDPSDDPTFLEEQQAEEQASYDVGERLEQEQTDLLAGKYRDAEELERAYLELQQKLGSRGSQQTEDESEEEDQPAEKDQKDDDYSFLDQLLDEYNSGEYTQDTLNVLDQLSSQDVADLLAQAAANTNQQKDSDAYSMSQSDILDMKGIVGGEQEYASMIGWAAENLSAQEQEIYDAVMDKGDPRAIYFAIQALNYRYRDSVGTEGRLLTGTAARSTDVFRSQAEVVRAMNDPRYENDPAYRQDIYDKLERSNLG
jgi:hypothetical protein